MGTATRRLGEAGQQILDELATTERRAKTVAGDAEWLRPIGEYPTLVRRPVVEHGGNVSVGFSAARFEEIFG